MIEQWQLILGFAMPLVIAVIVQSHWASEAKAAVAFLACALAAAGTVYLQGNWQSADLVSTILSVLVVAIASYKGLWKPTGVSDVIEQATNIPQSNVS